MSRTIKESLNQLETSLSDIKTSLANKKVEGGGSLKVSEVAGLIDQIQTGGGNNILNPDKWSNYCILFLDIKQGDYYHSCDGYIQPPGVFGNYGLSSFTKKNRNFYFVVAFYKVQDAPQTIKLTGKYQDAEEYPRSWEATFENIDLSKAGVFYYSNNSINYIDEY